MVVNIASLLDKAKVIHSLHSDYKLALVMGVSHNSLSSYRHGKTLPDARVIDLICSLTGDDSALIAVAIEEQRAQTTEARALWHRVAERLAAAGATAVFAVAFFVSGVAGFPSDAQAAARSAAAVHFLYIVERTGLRLTGLFLRFTPAVLRYLRGFFGSAPHVQSPASTSLA